MKIDAVAVTSGDMKKAVEFYTLLGFQFGPITEDTQHVEPISNGRDTRLMIDHKDLMKKITGTAPVPPSHSTFAVLCESPEDVDVVTEKVKDAGFTVIKEPWDAFWGQRYAIVADPDGYMVDLFAPLEK